MSFKACVLTPILILLLPPVSRAQTENQVVDSADIAEILSPIPNASTPLRATGLLREPVDLLPTLDSVRINWSADDGLPKHAAITLAELSTLAYTDQHNRELMLRLLSFDLIVPLDDGPMSGFIAGTDDVIVVAFRGTNPLSPRDWLANIDLFWQQSMGNGRELHKGFQKSYARFADTIKIALRDRNPKYVWLTGHSLGGAMATCCAYDWITSRMPLTGLVTFGQPRVANPTMVSFLDQQIGTRYLRFRNEDDIVPTVPPRSTLLSPDYLHAGRLAWIRDGKLQLGGLHIDSRKTGLRSPDRALDASDDADGDELNAVELLQLQRYLQERQRPETAEQIPNVLKSFDGSMELAISQHDQLSVDATRSLLKSDVRSLGIAAKFSDHSILEYIRAIGQLVPD